MTHLDEIAVDDREMLQGDCFTVAFILKESVDGPVVDLTGYDAEFGVEDLTGTADWLADASSTVTGPGAGTVDIDGPAGAVTATVPKTVTVDWAKQKKSVKYQIALINPEGCRDTQLIGFIEVVDAPIVNVGG